MSLCQRCGRYFFVDTGVSDELWKEIRPHYDRPSEAGLLCPECVIQRLGDKINEGRIKCNRIDISVNPKGREMSYWRKTSEELPNTGDPNKRPYEIEVLGFSERWVDPDDNPLGIKICTYGGDQWNCAKWCSIHDMYENREESSDEGSVPDYWRPMVKPPEEPKKK